MSSGNHMVDGADRELDRRGRCSCGGTLVEVDWCSEQHCECYRSCERNCPMLPCYMAETKLRCKKCGALVEAA